MESQEQTEQTYRLDANDLSTIFKRIGKYDRIRREVLETFKDNVEGRDFASTIRSYSEKFLNNTAGLRQLDRNTLQRRLIKDLERYNLCISYNCIHYTRQQSKGNI